MDINYSHRITPDFISHLKDNEIFVFGSNLHGMHGGGAARVAFLHFGAIYGQGVGLQGQSYAIPTMQGGTETIRPYVDEFILFAKNHPELTFLVTRIGCGIAGFVAKDIAPLFKDAISIENVHLPNDFWKVLLLTKDIYFAGGCFWGTEHYFKQIKGVVNTEVGYANGRTENPTYQEVYTDQTGYAETVHVTYNPDVVSLEFLLKMFFKAIDPTSLNKQGHDEGTRYRTGIYYIDSEDIPIIEKIYAEEQKQYNEELVVEKKPLQNFYTAEEYHQDYLDKNPNGYCHLPQSLFEYAREMSK